MRGDRVEERHDEEKEGRGRVREAMWWRREKRDRGDQGLIRSFLLLRSNRFRGVDPTSDLRTSAAARYHSRAELIEGGGRVRDFPALELGSAKTLGERCKMDGAYPCLDLRECGHRKIRPDLLEESKWN